MISVDQASRRRRPNFEPLEGRLLLSTSPSGPFQMTSGGASYAVALAGPGRLQLHKSGQAFSITLSGTTSASSVAVAQTSVTSKYTGSLLALSGITVGTGQLGQFLGGGAVDLVGTIQSSRPIQAIQLGEVSPSAQINANGGLGSLVVTGDLHLGPKGRIRVAGDLPGGLVAGQIELDGGSVSVGHNLASLTSGPITLGSGGSISVGNNLASLTSGPITLASGGSISVGNDVGPVQVTGNVSVGPGSSIVTGEDLASLAVSRGLSVDGGGRVAVGRDLTGAVSVGTDLVLDDGNFSVGRDLIGTLATSGVLAVVDAGNFSVGRDVVGAATFNGGLGLANGGVFAVGRNVDGGLTVGGNLAFAGGSTMVVGGDLVGLTVDGQVLGQGSSHIDLTVGLDLDNWTVLGGAVGKGSVSFFNLEVGKNLDGLQIAHGLFDDFITAGVLLTGGSTDGTVGPDGATAVFDTEIRAGLAIQNINFGGDVVSNRPNDPTAGLTRIVAGEDRYGTFEDGGSIIGLTISGSLINSAVAAGVEPFNGTGNFSLDPVPAPLGGGQGVYGPPAAGALSNYGIPFRAPAFGPGTTDLVLPGSINLPFLMSQTITINGVIRNTGLANGSDYAGFYASNTSGVFAGPATGIGS